MDCPKEEAALVAEDRGDGRVNAATLASCCSAVTLVLPSDLWPRRLTVGLRGPRPRDPINVFGRGEQGRMAFHYTRAYGMPDHKLLPWTGTKIK